MTDERSVAATFPTRIEAEIARARLEALGIAAWIDADDAGGLYPQFQIRGVRLLVSAAEKQAAERILALPETEVEDVSGDLESAERTVRDEISPGVSPLPGIATRALGAFVALLAIGLLLWKLVVE